MQIINFRVSKQNIFNTLVEREKERKTSPIDKIAGKAVVAVTIAKPSLLDTCEVL